MKKFFTLLTVILMTAVAFGQINPKPIYRVANNGPIRSDYYGNTTNNYVNTYEEDEIIILRLNAFHTPVAGEQLTQITFFWVAEYTSQNGPVAADPDFDVIIYQGGNANWINAVEYDSQFDNAGWYTTNPDDMGTQIATQHYTCTADGNQTVVLNTPITFTGDEGEIWIGLKANAHTCIGMNFPEDTPLTNWGGYLQRNYEESVSGDAVKIPVFYFDDPDVVADPRLTAMQLNFAAYIDDGQPYQPKSDFYVEMYDPESIEQYPEAVTSLHVDQYTDSIYFYGGAFNNGLDSSWGYYYRSIYIDGETPLYIEPEEALNEELDGVQSHYGWRFGPYTLFAKEDMETEGISFPFDICVTFRYESEASYNGIDPDLSNNTYCVTYTDQEVGIAENNNTLIVSPNPASTQIRVDNAAGAQISIFNIAGQEVLAIEAADANETINVSNLTEGVYVVRVVNGNEVATSKVSIVR